MGHHAFVAPIDANPYADALGDGTVVENGVVRGWLDGVLVFERTDVVLRKHRAIKVDEVGLDHYHGGTRPAEAAHPFQMAALVVAKSYIGPMQKKLAQRLRTRSRHKCSYEGAADHQIVRYAAP